MRRNIFKILCLLSIVSGIESYAQANDFYTENVRQIDAFIEGPIKLYNCEGGIKFPAKYKASKVRSDLRMISLLNSLFNNKTTKPNVERKISEVRRKKIPIEKTVNGEIESNDITILGKYLWMNVKFNFIGDVLVRSKVTLKTTTHGKCGSMTHLLDFKVLKSFFVKDAKMLFSVGYDDMTSDTIYSKNLLSLAEKKSGYKFNIPGSNVDDWINEIFKKQYQTDSAGAYNYTKAPKEFVKLIKENKEEVIRDLLFSPNYVTSINAMEALLYLASVNKVQLSEELSSRIAEIKNGSFIIIQQGAPDVYYKREGYKDLQMTDEKIVRKYSYSM